MKMTMPFGAECLENGQVRFRLWAPDKEQVTLCLYPSGRAVEHIAMQALDGGWHEYQTDKVGPGDSYAFQVDDLTVPDPASRYQPDDVHGPSQIIDPDSYGWKSADWQGKPWHEAIVYELHIGTFTEQGTFQAAINKLDYLQSLGITCIELMPLSDFPGDYNWGYDGVLLFAPDSAYGTPDDLKALIDACHQRGIMVLLDLVYNHFGPEGNYLWCYAKSFFTDRYDTPWGAAINYDGQASETVRQFFIANSLYWLNEYQFDGIRYDAVHCIFDQSSQHFLDELAATIRQQTPREHVHLILENDDNASRFLNPYDKKPSQFNAQWNDDIHHILHLIATGESEGYYQDYADNPVERLARCLAKGFDFQGDVSQYRQGRKRGESTAGLPLSAFVSFIQNHDHIGNRAFGERISLLAAPEKLKAVAAMVLLSPQIPLLYQGEEWGSEQPFFFFCDFNPELTEAVREGRRNEFAKFPEFRDPAMRDKLPDPCAQASFEGSKLDWNNLSKPAHQQWFTFYQRLIELRKTQLADLIAEATTDASTYQVHDNNLLEVKWQTQLGEWLLLGNLADDSRLMDGGSQAIDLAAANVIYRSDESSTSSTLAPWEIVMIKIQ